MTSHASNLPQVAEEDEMYERKDDPVDHLCFQVNIALKPLDDAALPPALSTPPRRRGVRRLLPPLVTSSAGQWMRPAPTSPTAPPRHRRLLPGACVSASASGSPPGGLCDLAACTASTASFVSGLALRA
ncbi:Protein of unknown function, partial [Gryllus bimaculatus]